MEHMIFYDQARSVPPEAKKIINSGRLKGMTDVNPMWRIKKLTELFGPCGSGWWYEITEKRIEADEATKQKAAFVDILLYYKDPESGEPSKGIPGTGGASFVAQERNGPHLSDECFKMALTDAISVAAKSIGIAADVYFSQDIADHDQPYGTKYDRDEDNKEPMKFKCVRCGKTLRPYKGKNGADISIRQHAEGSRKKFGDVYCLDCIQALTAQNAAAPEAPPEPIPADEAGT